MKNSKRYVLEVTGCMIVVIICAIIVFTYQDFPARLMAAILDNLKRSRWPNVILKFSKKN